jgi:2-keto-4-pentenoate hydratase/2-oxohepta-3-ene-1,7-dioic acid hydratase in catechol pathway
VVGERVIDLQAAAAALKAEGRGPSTAIPGDMLGLLRAGEAGMDAAREVLDAVGDGAAGEGQYAYNLSAVRLRAPVPVPPKILCIGQNYRDHVLEQNAKMPEKPIIFAKFATTVVGPGDDVIYPTTTKELDYEAELVVVIGRGGRHIPRERALEHVGGYAVGHDVSARDWQLNKPGKQWMAGKTFDTFAPVGPELVTPDEAGDPHKLGIRLRLNGQTMQDSNTNQLIFGVDVLIAYLSQVFTLEPGDLIFTGTPPGVGMARKPPVWLKPGDVVEVEIDRLGTLRNRVVAEDAPAH